MALCISRIGLVMTGVLLLSGAGALAVGYGTVDADVRYRWDEHRGDRGQLHALGLTGRKVFADSYGDRWIFFSQLEATDDVTELHLHQLYVLYKGPMGRWNITAGRHRLAFGLLAGYSAERQLFPLLESRTIGRDSDDGLMWSGVTGDVDYAVSLTRGAGRAGEYPRAGLLTARTAITRTDSGEVVVGLSGAAGRTRPEHGHHVHSREPRVVSAALDVTVNMGRAVLRAEATNGTWERRRQQTVVSGVDYGLFAGVELNCAVSLVRQAAMVDERRSFIGTTVTLPWLTIRGGYTYVDAGTSHHEIVVQLYRLFAFNF